jgi:hypothetical protein
MQERTEAARRVKLRQGESEPAERETGPTGLHRQIEDWCRQQWPPWKVLKARTDKRSTLPVGAHDMTIYADHGRVFNVECKAKAGKWSKDQRVWATELRVLGHVVYGVQSLDEFLALVLKDREVVDLEGDKNRQKK